MPDYVAEKIASVRSFSRFARGIEMPEGPLEIFLETSNVCDLRCVMCTEFSALNPHRLQFLRLQQRGFLNAEEIIGSLERVLAGALLVHCSGYGEPTLHPNFREFVSFVSRYQTLIAFITNGMHIDQSMAEFLVEQNVYRVLVSFSGTTKEEYENIYVGGNFERVLGGIRAIAAAKARHGKRYPIVEVNSLGFKHQVEHFDDFVELMVKAGANTIHLKKLQPYAHIPELFEHVSVLRPWVEGKMLQQAKERGRLFEVAVSATEYEAAGVGFAAEYNARRGQLRHAAERHLKDAPYGGSPIDRLPQIKKEQIRDEAAINDSVVPLDASAQEARALLRVGKIDGLAAAPFYCMEPFKTLYVRRDTTVKPCCFSNKPPYLGRLSESDGIDAWGGAGFRTFRDAIVEGEYPTDFCGRCVKDAIGPTDHFVHDLLVNFARWYSATHGTAFERQLEQEEPNIYATLARQNSHAIVAAHRQARRRGKPPGPKAPPGPEEFRAARVQGRFDEIKDNRALGWAWLPDYSHYRVPVTVFAGDKLVGVGAACHRRSDVEAHGRGDGFYGFNIPLPPRPEGWSREELTVMLGDSTVGTRPL